MRKADILRQTQWERYSGSVLEADSEEILLKGGVLGGEIWISKRKKGHRGE